MANHYQTIALSSGGVTQTKNVATGDTLYITAVPPSGLTKSLSKQQIVAAM
jgi:hypothetical protein